MIKRIEFNPEILKDYFNLKANQACKSCKRYNKSAKCPPYIRDISYYKELLPTYKYGVIVYDTFPSNKDTWEVDGRASSLVIHKKILDLRDELFYEGVYYSIALGAGSCKYCEKCTIPCRYPNKSIVPIEGTGIDVVNLMKSFNIGIKFPVEEQDDYYRIGMLLYG